MRAPFPYFGGKSSIAGEVWARFGEVLNYVEPFFGSGAVLLARPRWEGKTETVNDLDGMLANFWRAVKADPEAVARWADWPVNENDLSARHSWLVGKKESLSALLEGDPEYFDAKVAGWWVWGLSCWIGSGWCSGNGPWSVEDGRLVRSCEGGVHRKLPYLAEGGKGVTARERLDAGLFNIMTELSNRLRRVRVCCGDWSRVCGPSPTRNIGLTGVFLDPPYGHSERDAGIYSHEMEMPDLVREWAIEHGGDKRMRIALCGYEGEHDMPEGWETFRWNNNGGYGNGGNGRGKENAKREVVWFSPHCLGSKQPGLF